MIRENEREKNPSFMQQWIGTIAKARKKKPNEMKNQLYGHALSALVVNLMLNKQMVGAISCHKFEWNDIQTKTNKRD